MVEHVAVHVTEVRNGKVALRRFSICQILSLWISKEVNYFFVTKSQKSTADKRIHLLLWIPFKNNWLVQNQTVGQKYFPLWVVMMKRWAAAVSPLLSFVKLSVFS